MPDPSPRRSRRGQAILLLAMMAFGLLTMTICLPSMQQWAGIFGTSQAQVQLTFGAYVVSYGAFQLVYGPLSDRHGRRLLMVAGLGVAVLGLVLAALARSIDALVAARFVQGAGAAACMVLGRAAIQDLFSGPERTRMMAYVGMAMGLCPPLATVLGGQLHVVLGWQSNFVVMAVVGSLLMVTAWRGLPAAPVAGAASPAAAQPARSGWLADFAELLAHRQYRFNVLILALNSASFYAFLGGAPVLLGHLGVGPDRVGFFIMMIPMSYIVGNFLSTRVVVRWGEAAMRHVGAVLTLSGIVAVVLLSWLGVHHPLALSVPLMLLGIGHGLWIPPTLGATVGAVPALAGSAAALAGVSQQLLGALGGYAVGWIPLTTAAPLALLMLSISLTAAWSERQAERRPTP
ncbi:MAG: multidrug effflux MFS transporter [Rubrivivax sp.]|nr:multidrug effflux MFS transporter [Rubrivivax sp.]